MRYFLALTILLFDISVLHAEPLKVSGRALVLDGDTIMIGKQKIRLWGMDAPEWSQTCKNKRRRSFVCGQVAAYRLAERVDMSTVDCVARAKDVFGRMVAQCSVAGEDLAGFMVSKGYAQDFPRYSRGFYKAKQDEAKLNKRGFWSGIFPQPWDYRKNQKHPKPLAVRD